MFYEQQGIFQGEKNLEKRGNIQSILRVNSEIALSARKNKENRHDSVSSHPKSPCVKRLSRCWITFVKANEEKLDRKYIQKEEMHQFSHLSIYYPTCQLLTCRTLDLLRFESHFLLALMEAIPCLGVSVTLNLSTKWNNE